MLSSLSDFLNHGILPFGGRSSVAERIVSFWRATADATELRVGLMIGEAGIGKSRLVSGTDDPAKARKTMNGVVFRLRDLLGHDAILTDHDTPKLNLELIEVDILEAHALLRKAAGALRSGSLLRRSAGSWQCSRYSGAKFPSRHSTRTSSRNCARRSRTRSAPSS